ncbi:MAG: hypothetical protein DWQ01_10975 [Planctomycetota bacterium]|nr:MAG: hypothetical protein DWQ01_10975 [Planctomycetota bacterium]
MVKQLLSSAILIILFSSTLRAQQNRESIRLVEPTFAGVYRVAKDEFLPASRFSEEEVQALRSGKGTRFRGPAPLSSQVGAPLGPDILYNNMSSMCAPIGPFGPGIEWIDGGGLLDRSECRLEQINAIEICYWSSFPDPNQDLGEITITLYDDYVPCTGPCNWPTANFTVQVFGVPLGTANGGFQSFTIVLDLQGFEVPNCLGETFYSEGEPSCNPSLPLRKFGIGISFNKDDSGPCAFPAGGHGSDGTSTSFDPATGTFMGCFASDPMCVRLYGPKCNSRVFRSDVQRELDTLCLFNTTNVKGDNFGIAETWEVSPAAGDRWYMIYASTTPVLPKGVPITGKAGALGTRLVAPAWLWPTPWGQFGNGVFTFVLPTTLPCDIYVQAAERTGPGSMGLQAVSNGLHHCFCP